MGLIKNEEEIRIMRNVGKLTSAVLSKLIIETEVGMTGNYINERAGKLFKAVGIEPAFLGLYGFPAVLCISINENIIHGLPDDVPFKNGDVIKYDIGARLNGYCSDTARTFIVGKGSEEHSRIIWATKEALDRGIKVIREGATMVDIATAIEGYAKEKGYGNVEDFHGHGIGTDVHELPPVHNAVRYAEQRNIVLKEGMVLALEPMFTLGSGKLVKDKKNPWRITSEEGVIGAHFEDTVLVLKNGYEILTR